MAFKRLFFFLVFLPLYLSAAESLDLCSRLRQAEAGDFLVSYQNKTFTLMHIHSINERYLVIEELSVSGRHRNTYALSWKDWVGEGCPQHSSWVMYELDLTNGSMTEYYSFTKQGWADVGHSDNFLSSILTLQLSKVPPEQRRRRGPPPHNHERDNRPIWHPKVVVDGKTVPSIRFDAWKAQWPQDGSDLAGKTVELYLPEKEGKYPSYFPYWIEIKKGALQAKLRIVDSGTGMVSPQKELPRRPPEFLKAASYEEGKLNFTLKTRPYYEAYTLLAVDAANPSSRAIQLVHKQETSEQLTVQLSVAKETLERMLKSGHRYYFYVSPKGFDKIFTRTEEAHLWSPDMLTVINSEQSE